MATDTPEEIVIDLIEEYDSLRDFARVIGEDPGDVVRWKYGRAKIRPRAVITICRLHPEVPPHRLCPEIFPADLTLKFGERNNE